MSESAAKLKQLFFDIMGYRPKPGPDAKGATKQAEKENEDKEKKPVAQLYQGRAIRSGVSLYSVITGDYATPLLEYGQQREEKIVLEQLGDLPENVQFAKLVPVLEEVCKE